MTRVNPTEIGSRMTVIIVGLILMLDVAASWAGPPPNIIASDADANTAGGTNALQSNDTGSGNTAFGTNALASNADGTSNTASGDGALQSNTDGDDNTAIGDAALVLNTLGNRNTATGAGALFSNSDGSGNTASGVFALFSNAGGNLNTATGFGALQQITAGSNNIAFGHAAGIDLVSGSDNIYIGSRGTATESNTLRLGSTQTRAFLAGIGNQVGFFTGVPVLINKTTGQLGIILSSARYKNEVQDIGMRSAGLQQLRPVTFHYKGDAQKQVQYGLIAEEVAQVYPELVVRGSDGQVETVRYQELVPLLLNEVQHQQHELAKVKAQNARLETALRQVQAQSQELAALKAQVAALAALAGQGHGPQTALAVRQMR